MKVQVLNRATGTVTRTVEGSFEHVGNEYNLMVAALIKAGHRPLGDTQLVNGRLVTEFSSGEDLAITPDPII